MKTKFTAKIGSLTTAETEKFLKAKAVDGAKKEEHLRLFRPNLANPANKQITQQLNENEKKRSQDQLEVSGDGLTGLVD